MKMLVQVVLPYCVAGVIVKDGRIVEAAPILRGAVGKSLEYLSQWVATHRNGELRVVRRWNEE